MLTTFLKSISNVLSMYLWKSNDGFVRQWVWQGEDIYIYIYIRFGKIKYITCWKKKVKWDHDEPLSQSYIFWFSDRTIKLLEEWSLQEQYTLANLIRSYIILINVYITFLAVVSITHQPADDNRSPPKSSSVRLNELVMCVKQLVNSVSVSVSMIRLWCACNIILTSLCVFKAQEIAKIVNSPEQEYFCQNSKLTFLRGMFLEPILPMLPLLYLNVILNQWSKKKDSFWLKDIKVNLCKKLQKKTSYITLAPPRTMVVAQKMTWKTASTKMKIWSWCNASTATNGTWPCNQSKR